MPVINVPLKESYARHYHNLSFELLCASWLLANGWDVFSPLIDHGSKTDLLISDRKSYYRIQIKAVDTVDEAVVVENKWNDTPIDYVIYFSKQRDWGYVAKPFRQKQKRLDSPDHIRFHQHPKNFIKAFRQA
ncbi:hypothetical protein [Microbulbifer agarilyticus]